MPNGLPHDKKYGPHKYPGDGSYTVDCEHGCRCSMGPSSSHGPLGLDPGGACPKNPEDGKLLGGDKDYRCVVETRIRDLQKKASERDKFEKLAGTEQVELLEQNRKLRRRLTNISNTFNHFKENMSNYLRPPEKSSEESPA